MNNGLLQHIRFWEYEFYDPHWLWLLLLIPVLLIFRYFRLEKSDGVFKFSQPLSQLKAIEFTPIKWLIFGVYTLIGLGFSLLVIAMALPVSIFSNDSDKEYD